MTMFSQANSKFRLVFFMALWACLLFVIQDLHKQFACFESRKPDLQYGREIANPETVKMLSLGFNRVAADLYWLLFVQYYGDIKAADHGKYALAPAYLDLITKLDPHFIQPYWFASFALAAELKLEKESQEILDFGIKENPKSWIIPYVAGFNEYLYLNDIKKAAYYYHIASLRPGAPAWLSEQVKVMESGVPLIVKTTHVWLRIFKTAEDPILHEKARTKLRELFSQIYWTAPTQKIKEVALWRLQTLDVKLLPKEALP